MSGLDEANTVFWVVNPFPQDHLLFPTWTDFVLAISEIFYLNPNFLVNKIYMYRWVPHQQICWRKWLLGTLRSDDGDATRTPQKQIGLIISKTTILHVHHTFLYSSLTSLHDYDMKMPNFTMYRGSTQATTKFPFSFWTWIYRVCKFYWWVEPVWLLLHKFWSHFGIFGVKYHNKKSHFQTFRHLVLACIHYSEGYTK